MSRFFASIFIVLFLFSCSTVLNQNTSTENPALFSIDGKSVHKEEFLYVYSKNNASNDQAFTQKDIEEYLALFINFKLKIAEGKAQGLDTTKTFLREFNMYKNQLAKPYLYDDSKINQLKRQAYERLQYQVRASHILIKTDSEDTLAAYNQIMDIRQKALEGQDFGQLAKEFSEDPSAKSNQGDLGYFSAFQMVYPFEVAAYNTEPGSISMPVRTNFGYHIVKVIDKKPNPGKVEVAHIMASFKNITSAQDSTNLENRIFEIHQLLQAGEDWDYLCKQYSDDINTRNKGGVLKPFGSGQLPKSFEDQSFALQNPGEYSDPFTTSFGWHIVKLIQKVTLAPYEEVEEDLENRVRRGGRLGNETEDLVKKIKKEYGYIIEEENKTKALSLIDKSILTGSWVAPEVEETEVLATIGEKNVTLQDWVIYVKGNQRKKNSVQDLDAYKNLLFTTFENKQLIEFKKAQLEKENPEYRHLLTEYYEGIILFELMENEVWKKATEDEEGLNQYYQNHLNEYRWPKRINGLVLEFNKEEELNKVKSDIEVDSLWTAINREQIVEKYGTETPLFVKVEEGLLDKEQHIALQNVEWARGIQQTEIDGRYYLIVVKEVIDSEVKQLVETKGAVIADYQNQIEKDWLASLRKKYKVNRNEKQIANVIKEIKK